MKKKSKILNVIDEYLLSNSLFCWGGSKWRFGAKLQDGENVNYTLKI